MSRKPLVTRTNKPGDYSEGFHRGTVDYREDWKNYSFHKVRIPSGTVVENCNFTQIEPKTQAIIVEGDPKTVTFRECNLANVALSSGWTVENCNTMQYWKLEVTDPLSGELVWENDRIAGHPDEIEGTPTKPDNAITTKDE